jgi:hypothetical protein
LRFHGGEDVGAVLLGFGPEDGDSMFLRNVGTYRRVYMEPKPRKTSSFMTMFTRVHQFTEQLDEVMEMPQRNVLTSLI